MTSSERQHSEGYGTSDEDNQPNYPKIASSGTRDDKEDVSANALERARILAESGSKIFDADSLKANQTRVDRAIKELGLYVISDEQLDKELDEMLALHRNEPFGKLMGEARRRFIYRKDLDVVAKRLKEKLNL